MKKILTLSLSILLLSSLSLWAQKENQMSKKEEITLAEDFIEDENFSDAIRLYTKIIEIDSTNSDINFKLGFCYLNTAIQRDKAIHFLENSIKYMSTDKKKRRNNAPLEAFYYLGKAYHVNGDYEKAIETLNELKIRLNGKDEKFDKAIDRLILRSQSALELVSNPVKMSVENLGPIVNSEYTDHSPVFSADEEILIFTSRREGSTGDKLMRDGEYYEDLYICYKDDNQNWMVPKNMGKPINTPDHEASISLSPDGQELFIYKSEDNGSIYVSENDGENWSKPKKLGSTINTSARETSASVSVDGNTIYFTSDRSGGYGGLDIYVAQKLPNGEWGEAKNLGKTINTPFDEESPYIHPDGKTLYFSSKGHKNMGGFDIFISTKNKFDTWTVPENIGYPINTTGDDVFFIPTLDRKRAYYSSVTKDGYGRSDIYMMYIPENEGNNITLVRGQIAICTGRIPKMTITTTDSETDEVVSIVKPSTRNGKFILIFNHSGEYTIQYEKKGNILKTETIKIDNNKAYKEIKKLVKLKSGTPCDATFDLLSSEEAEKKMIKLIFFNGKYYDRQLEIKNILFPFGKAAPITSNSSLDTLAMYLQTNPEAKVEIGAFADAVGSDAVNLRITQKRAKVVVDYLVKKGVSKSQLVSKGYGESNPIAINKNPNGSWNKEAQKYNRRIEFRVLNQGNKKLLIKPMTNIPEKYKNKNYIWKQ